MIRKYTLLIAYCLIASLISEVSFATTYIDYGSSNTYSLNSGDSLYIASGTYTGIINGFPSGAKITVADGAVFQPSSLAFPNIHGTMYVYGTFTMTTQFRSNSDFTLHNYGVVVISSTTLMSGTGQIWNNYYTGLINFVGDVSITNDNSIVNYGNIVTGANVTMTGTSSIINKRNITITGDYLNSGGTLTNQGKFETKGSITFNSGQAIVNNFCRMLASGGINNTTGFVYNYSYIWAKDSLGLGNIVNSGTITNGPNAILHSKNFNNTGAANGAGYFYFTGYTTTTNLGKTGVSGFTTDTIKFYDITRSNPLTIYDNQSGTVYPNVVYRSFSAPDSMKTYVIGCASEMIGEIPLAVEWNYFYVTLSHQIPDLTWSSETDQETFFEVQRSYDGTYFNTINTTPAKIGQPENHFKDVTVSTKSEIVYYRIKAVEINGSQKYSVTRSVRFGFKAGDQIQVTPNPFTSKFSLNYQADEKSSVTIRIFNMSGQQQLLKYAEVNAGYNSVSIQDVAGLAKGVYVIQVSRGYKIIASEKVIKQ